MNLSFNLETVDEEPPRGNATANSIIILPLSLLLYTIIIKKPWSSVYIVPKTPEHARIKFSLVLIHAITSSALPRLQTRHKRYALFLYAIITLTVCIIVVWVGKDFRVGFSNQVRRPVCFITHSVHHGNASSYEKVSQSCAALRVTAAVCNMSNTKDRS